MGLLTQDDAKQFRDYAKECFKLLGFRVGYQYPLGTEKTIHSEPNMSMSNPIPLDIIFNENPTLDTLRKHGWVVEIGEQTPVVAQVPYDTPHLQRYSRIIIPPVGTIVDARVFEVTGISTILEYPDCWTVRLAPVFNTIEEVNDYVQSNLITMEVESEGTMDVPGEPRNYDQANIDVPDKEIIQIEQKQVKRNRKPKQKKCECNNVLKKDFNELGS